MQQSVRRVDPFSVMKVCGVLYALLGLFIGMIFSLFSMVGLLAASGSSDAPAIFGFLFGAAAIVLAPVFYGILGAIGGLIMAALYNVIAKFTGGIQVELG